MPRNTCRPSECAAASQDEPEASANNNNNNSNNNNNNEGIIKQELEAAPPVCHRKSERRRVARDIFLVFEEQTTRRRGKGARGKATRAKQKFGHLKVANTPRINKNVLRDIKTEPKCSSEAVVPAAAPAIIPIPALNPPISPQIAALNPPLPEEPTLAKSLPRTAAVKLETKTHVTSTATASNVAAPKRISPKPKAPSVQEKEKEVVSAVTPVSLPIPKPAAAPATSPTTPSVNPIFLWVKQDDTRIVEVRCEDYDKRNRIRLTKTTNGWRSMPRTDASSTRIVKFFHGSAAPLMKVKREQHLQRLEEEEQQHQEQELEQAEDHEREQEQSEQQMPSIGQTLLQDWDDSATQLPDEIEEQEEEEERQESDAAQQQNGHLATVLEDVVVMPPAQEPEMAPTPCFDGLLDSEETNASTKATKTNTPTYQSSTPSPLQMQLCPKTGLFLPKGDLALVQLPEEDVLPEEAEDKPLGGNDAVECFDANTKNLKDLLDDADDLLQNCSSENGTSGADLLDSLVKRSCEDNLVQETRPGNGTNPPNSSASGDGLSSFCVPDLDKDLPRILNMDNDDAPKCLSFNEAGEIEGLNGELFLGIEAFEKQHEAVATEPEPQPPTPATVEMTQTPTPTPTPEKEMEKSAVVEETPKDLSYKKREEVCPPSESRSQCAVTSSSDILKSPERELQLPANSIPAEVETTSETIKNLILEQFLKLNNNPQQAEPMDLGKAGRDGKLETVVIDDEEEEDSSQPLKKRPKASIKMDKDPDPLTQLKMLISNPQWKVPDPILVPKDRLGAVLASPAREIPLLLTTRPELRLPEAFAYPEIIQNPNILVVTMEQLEAILKTESEQAAKVTKDPDPVIVVPSKARSPSPKQIQPKPVPVQPKPPAVAPVAPTPPSPADSSLSTDLNATTLALLQQMLWLPYFGQLSQEFFKTIKDPLGLQRKFMSNLLPLYNNQFGLQHLDELYKHCMKQKSTEEQPQPKVTTPVPPPAAAPPPPLPQSTASGPNSFNGFTNPVELALMQKLLQPQLPQFLNWEAAKEASSTSSAAATSNHHHHQEHKRPRRETETESISNFTKSKPSSGAPTTTAAPPPAAAAPVPVATAAPPAPAPAEHKPRLTIKSLSNLLEPEANVVPLLNVPFDGMRGRPSMHKAVPDQAKGDAGTGRTLRSSKACVTYNPLEQAKQQMHPAAAAQQQRKRGNMLAQDVQQQQHQQNLADAAAAAGMDANSALWHPLFGSNPKQGYNSPWQWTTVTASGE
uniref:AT12326p n=1 Tax=Drosophila melanogaster TaxID=7227 RepID=Q8IHD5_DROME|nr:AT12326p [Drosophila melanogaster]AAR99085.1 SD06669p [Drosophila melanogaster]